MNLRQKIKWMKNWAKEHGLALTLNGEVGFGRPCIGVWAEFSLDQKIFPDYMWFDEKYERIDQNGEVYQPQDAYHKHPCVAVLGTGKSSIYQLYKWLRWFDENNFVAEIGLVPGEFDDIQIMLGQNLYARMVRVQKDG